ncbi:hypothetical protein KC353_g24 [Hortaea werneckii]|nr:hypothetical protein KC353_g24 [Hortaea werneckii]
MEERMPETVLDMGLLDDASDDADSSGNAIVMAHNSSDCALLQEAGVNPNFTPSRGPCQPPLDTNMQSAYDKLHPAASNFNDAIPSVCEWGPRDTGRRHAHISASHKIFLWPAIYRRFALGGAVPSPNLRPLAWIGSSWLMRKSVVGNKTLQCEENGVLFPLLDRQPFMTWLFSRLSRQGYKDNDPESVLALLKAASVVGLSEGLLVWDFSTGLLGGVGSYRRNFLWKLCRYCCCRGRNSKRVLDTPSSGARSVQQQCHACVSSKAKPSIGHLNTIEFCVADTGIETLANLVQMPHFPDILFEEQQSRHAGDLSPRGSMVPQENDYAYHFSATTALGRLIRRANDIVHEREPVLHGRPSEVSVAHAKDEFSVKIWNSSNMMEFPFSSCERWPKNSTLAGLAWHTILIQLRVCKYILLLLSDFPPSPIAP